MPTVVDHMPSPATRTTKGHRWAKYLDGRVYRFVEGVDFTATASSKSKNMLAGFWRTCRVNGLRAVRKERMEDGVRVLYLQAVKISE